MRLTRSQLAGYLVQNNSTSARNRVAAYLVESGRTKELDQIIRQVEVLLFKDGRAVTHTTSAHELNTELEKQITSLVKQDKSINTVEIINTIDPSLLGGVIVRTPETEVDVSVRSQLNQLRQA